MLGRAIWDKLPQCILENFGIAQVEREQFQIDYINRVIITIIVSIIEMLLLLLLSQFGSAFSTRSDKFPMNKSEIFLLFFHLLSFCF